MPVNHYEGIGPCWNWAGNKTTLGYPVIQLDKKSAYLHRVAYADFHGVALDDLRGLVVRHRCDNPSCVNPMHLQLGTQGDNIRDIHARDRFPRTTEVRQRMSEAQKKRFAATGGMPEQQKERLRNLRRGTKLSEEHRQKIAAAGVGRKASPETKERLRAAWALRKASKEQSWQA